MRACVICGARHHAKNLCLRHYDATEMRRAKRAKWKKENKSRQREYERASKMNSYRLSPKTVRSFLWK